MLLGVAAPRSARRSWGWPERGLLRTAVGMRRLPESFGSHNGSRLALRDLYRDEFGTSWVCKKQVARLL